MLGDVLSAASLGLERRLGRLAPSPAMFHGGRSWRHFGLMIPRLPEPYGWFDVVLAAGLPGFAFYARPDQVIGRPRDTATVLCASAAHAHVGWYGRSEWDVRDRGDPVSVRLGDDVTIEGAWPDWTVRVRSPGFEADLRVRNSDRVTWFARYPLVYRHLAVLSSFEGALVRDGVRTEVAGTCSFEHATGRATHDLGLRAQIPVLRFRYDVLDLDDGRQILLADLRTYGGRPVMRRGWIKGFDVDERVFTRRRTTVLETVDADGPEGTVRVPARWREELGADGLRCTLEGELTTPPVYGLGRGFVAGFRFEGACDGPIGGRGYLEYVDVSG